jgi:hypothetical protein
LAERDTLNVKVPGSIPGGSIIFAGIVQLEERSPCKREVAGSIPAFSIFGRKMNNFFTFSEDEIHTILFALLQLNMNLDQQNLIDKIKDQIVNNKFKENVRRAG